MTDWPHAPLHRISEKGTYMVTAGTYNKIHYFQSPDRLNFLQDTLLLLANQYNWRLQAWALFSNHYHFIAQSPDNPENLPAFLSHLHVKTAMHVNALDSKINRQVWYQYRDTRLTYQNSYFARLNYVMQNPVRHKLVDTAEDYLWCSVRWFMRTADASLSKTVLRFKTDSVKIIDDYDN